MVGLFIKKFCYRGEKSEHFCFYFGAVVLLIDLEWFMFFLNFLLLHRHGKTFK